jgi:hypothetical protein
MSDVMVLTRERPETPAPTRTTTSPQRRGGREDMVRAVDSGDAVLVARLTAGDEEALAEVWQRHGPLVFGLARRLTGDSSTAEDVTQEVFVTLWQQPQRFDAQRGSLRAYLGFMRSGAPSMPCVVTDAGPSASTGTTGSTRPQ